MLDQPMSVQGVMKQFIAKRLIDNLHESRSRNARRDHWDKRAKENDDSIVEAG